MEIHHSARKHCIVDADIEFKKFLRQIDAAVPAELDGSPDPRQLHDAQDQGRAALAFGPPTVSPSLHPDGRILADLVERWFAELTNKKLRRGAHRSVRELNTDIRSWIDHWNENPRPYIWTKTADQILDSLSRYCQRINNSRH